MKISDVELVEWGEAIARLGNPYPGESQGEFLCRPFASSIPRGCYLPNRVSLPDQAVRRTPKTVQGVLEMVYGAGYTTTGAATELSMARQRAAELLVFGRVAVRFFIDGVNSGLANAGKKR